MAKKPRENAKDNDRQNPAPAVEPVGLVHSVLTNTGRTATGFAILGFYMAFISAVFFGFATYVARVDTNQDLKANSLTLDTMLLRLSAERAFAKKLLTLKAEQARLHLRAIELANALSAEEKRYDVLAQKLIITLLPAGRILNDHSGLIDAASRDQISALISEAGADPNTELKQIIKAWTGLKIIHPDTSTPTPSPAKLNAASKALVQSLKKFQEELLAWEQKVQEKRFSVALHDQTLTAKLKEIQDIQDQRIKLELDKISTDYRARIESFEKSFAFISHYLLRLPTIVLTLIVTMAAGGLGATVSLTRNFITESGSIGASKLLGSVGEGVAAAVGIFFLAGAGMLMLSQGAGQGANKAELSPYLVAFVAFVSGFMAKDAFLRIQSAGRNMFRDPDPAP